MSGHTIRSLLEALLLEYVVSDPREPESLSGAIPILDRMAAAAQTLSDDRFARYISRARGILEHGATEGNARHVFADFEIALNQIAALFGKDTGCKKTEAADPAPDNSPVLSDFVKDALKSLDEIELLMVELERDPMDTGPTNRIFKLFRSIKGVSGFLSLKKINTLAHTTEMLLDNGRDLCLAASPAATDAILDAVDLLRQLLERVRLGIDTKTMPRDDDIRVAPLQERIRDLRVLLTRNEQLPIGEILIRKGIVDREGMGHSLKRQQAMPGKPIGEILVEEQKAAPIDIAAALMEQKNDWEKKPPQVQVNARELDNLVTAAGDLLLAQSLVRQEAAAVPGLLHRIGQLETAVTQVQTAAVSMRRVPVRPFFIQMARFARDLARESGKAADVTIQGETTEIDRKLVHTLYEPIAQAIRHALAYNIEPAAERKEKQKAEKGRIRLNAYPDNTDVVIRVSDDGRGIEPDIPRLGIERYGGHLTLDASPGKGTSLFIRLPLVPALIDGFLVRINKEKCIVPSGRVRRIIPPGKDGLPDPASDRFPVRDRVLPLVRPCHLFREAGETTHTADSRIMVLASGGNEAALQIDELLGRDEYAILTESVQPGGVTGFGGEAVLGNGQTAMILDLHALFEMVTQRL